MLFTNIAALVAKGIKLTLTVEQAGEGMVEVTVVPSAADPSANKSGVSLVAKSFKATPAEFDAEGAEIIKSFCASTLTLKEQLQAADQMIAQAAKQASDVAVTASTKPATKPALKAATTAAAPKAAGRAAPELLPQGSGSADDDADDDAQDEGGDAPDTTPQGGAGSITELSL